MMTSMMKSLLPLWIAVLALPVQAAERAGAVLMATGEAKVTRGGQAAVLKVGDEIRAGDSLATGERGHVYMRFEDGSFVVLRPGTVAEVEDYSFNSSKAGDARVRFGLKQGVMRTITGKGLQANKDRFRLNTPLAAIGVRGTDFTTYADAETTRVSVYQGGVVLAPLGQSCPASSLGPCEGGSAAELFAGSRSMLELRKGQPRADILPLGNTAPDKVRPPLEGEPSVPKANTASSAKSDVQAAIQDALAIEKIEAISAQLSKGTATETPSGSTGGTTPPPVVVTPPPTIKLQWGRWQSLAGQADAPFSFKDLSPDTELVALNSTYAITRDKQGFELPKTGAFNFDLKQSEAFLVSTSAAQALTVSNPTLSIDFAKREFSTHLDVASTEKSWAINANGDISLSGKLISIFKGNTNSVVSGALGGQNGSDAAYVFQRTLDQQQQITGATYWTRR
jgi:hypothetical protein